MVERNVKILLRVTALFLRSADLFEHSAVLIVGANRYVFVLRFPCPIFTVFV